MPYTSPDAFLPSKQHNVFGALSRVFLFFKCLRYDKMYNYSWELHNKIILYNLTIIIDKGVLLLFD